LTLVDRHTKTRTIVRPHLAVAALEELGQVRHRPLALLVFQRPTTVEGSPALNVSTVSGFHSTSAFCRMRSTTACAVGVADSAETHSSVKGLQPLRLHRA
jgi:hypothetical protein